MNGNLFVGFVIIIPRMPDGGQCVAIFSTITKTIVGFGRHLPWPVAIFHSRLKYANRIRVEYRQHAFSDQMYESHDYDYP